MHRQHFIPSSSLYCLWLCLQSSRLKRHHVRPITRSEPQSDGEQRGFDWVCAACCRQSWQQLTGRVWFFSKRARIKLWLCTNELRYASEPPPACVCVRGRVCDCACALRTRAQGRHSAAYSAAVCHSDRVPLFALITTATFLDPRVRSRQKRLGTESIDTERRKYHRALFDLRFIYITWVPCKCIGCVSFSFSVWGVSIVCKQCHSNQGQTKEHMWNTNLEVWLKFYFVIMLELFNIRKTTGSLITLLTGQIIDTRVTGKSHLSSPLGVFELDLNVRLCQRW